MTCRPCTTELLLVAVAFIGCHRTRATAPPANTIAKNTAETAALEASRSLELDYDSPMRSQHVVDRQRRVSQMYSELCRDGDPDICLLASRYPFSGSWVAEKIAANCTAGHALSCRYVAWHANDGIEPKPLSTIGQHRACAAGVLAECLELEHSKALEEARFGRDLLCVYARRDCIEAAESYLSAEARDVERARYLLESGCQMLDRFSCERLARAYLTRELPEPLPGRGIELQRFACDQWQLCEQKATP
jgi:hypothetical protein